MSDELKLPHYAKKLLARIADGRKLCRTAADTDEAMTKGGGYLYFTTPDNRKASPASSKLLIDAGAVQPVNDGLFEGTSQTFVVAEHA